MPAEPPRPGDLMVMYTDGVTEGRRGHEFYGEQRLHRAVVEHRDAGTHAESILGDVLDFQQGTARDDIAVVAVRVPPLSDRAQPPFRTEPSS